MPGGDNKCDKAVNQIRRLQSFLDKFVIYLYMKPGHFFYPVPVRQYPACLMWNTGIAGTIFFI